MSADFAIDKEFQSLIPPLEEDERDKLQESLVSEGCRDDLVIGDVEGKKLLLDGHHRLAICKAKKIPFKIKLQKFLTRLHARVWIRHNQLARRNLSENRRVLMAMELMKEQSQLYQQERAKIARKFGGKMTEAQRRESERERLTYEAGDAKDSRREAAAAAKVPVKKIRQMLELEKAEAEGLLSGAVAKVKSEEWSIARAHGELRRAQLLAKLSGAAAMKEKIAAGRFDVVILDPPWPLDPMIDGRPIDDLYKPMDVGAIYNRLQDALVKHCADKAHVFCWVTHKYLPIALAALERMQLSGGSRLAYDSVFSWTHTTIERRPDRPEINSEFCIYMRRANPQFLSTKDLRAAFAAPRSGALAKPRAFFDMLRKATAGRRLIMFSRQKEQGFESWGAEQPEQRASSAKKRGGFQRAAA